MLPGAIAVNDECLVVVVHDRQQGIAARFVIEQQFQLRLPTLMIADRLAAARDRSAFLGGDVLVLVIFFLLALFEVRTCLAERFLQVALLFRGEDQDRRIFAIVLFAQKTAEQEQLATLFDVLGRALFPSAGRHVHR